MPRRCCDEDCNRCPLVVHPNSRMLTRILNELNDRFGAGDQVYETVQAHCPNLTVCYDCRIDDFCHAEGCPMAKNIEEGGEMQIERRDGTIETKTYDTVKEMLKAAGMEAKNPQTKTLTLRFPRPSIPSRKAGRKP